MSIRFYRVKYSTKTTLFSVWLHVLRGWANINLNPGEKLNIIVEIPRNFEEKCSVDDEIIFDCQSNVK